MEKLKVLEVGPNTNPQAQLIWPDAEIVTLDIDPECKPTIIGDAGAMPADMENVFDHVFASHVLEHFSYWNTVAVLKEWRRVVKPGTGLVHVIVPSIEWAAEQILSEKPCPGLWGHLLGGHLGPHDIHLAGFTMRFLRACFETADLAVLDARTTAYTLRYLDKEYKSEQHYCCGMRKT